MNIRKSRRLYRLVSVVATISLVMSICGGVVAPRPAAAQYAAPMQVGVVEFRNESGVQGDLLARFATDAVVIELSKSNRFDVITRAQIEAQMKELGLATPLSRVEVSRLGEALAAEAMIEGSIKAIEVRGTEANRRAAVTLVVRMVDQPSGEVVNGAIQTGFSHARVGYTPDADKLIAEAIDNAAYLAVKTMIDYIIPEATVLNTIRANEVMLNKGARDGIRLGMRMIVTRENEIIGELEIRQIDPNNSTGFITKALRGIRPEDKARAVFDMPAIERVKADPTSGVGVPPTAGKKKSTFGKLGKLLLGGLVLWGVSSIFSRSGEQVGGIAAEAGLSGYALPVESGTAGVRVKWDRDKLSRGVNVIEYHIWRNDVAGPVLVARASEGEAFDDANARAVTYSSADPQTREMTSGETDVPAMTLGRPYRYSVSALYLVQTLQDEDPQYFETERKHTGQATPISQILAADLRLPLSGSQQNLHKVTFEWLSRRGADTYIVEASTDPIFRNPEYVSNTVAFSPSLDVQPVRLEVTEALYNAFKSVPSDQPIWWRVGARASGDRPGPIPPEGRSNMRYIYSEANRFYPVEMPPPQPQ